MSGGFGPDTSDKAFLRSHIRDMRTYCNFEKKNKITDFDGLTRFLHHPKTGKIVSGISSVCIYMHFDSA
jgi:hypothetical protein